MKPSYSMSSVGDCPRALGAVRLGNDPTTPTSANLDRLRHYSRCEALAAQQMVDEGFVLEDVGHCSKCDRNGIHVEIDTPLFRLVGHLDRRATLSGNYSPHDFPGILPVEIKSLGKSSWENFRKSQFEHFSEYAAQEACYLEAEGSPGLYWVMERDSGQALRYVVNDPGMTIQSEGFEHITLPITFEQILDKLNQIEVEVSEGILPDVTGEDCFWCGFQYLCPKQSGPRIDEPDLSTAAEVYRKGLELEKQAIEFKNSARDTFLIHAKESGQNKFRANGISFSYGGRKRKRWLDESTIRKSVPAEIVSLAERQSEEFDSYTIRVLKED